MIEFVALFASFAAIFLIAGATIATGTPPVPTSNAARLVMLSLCPTSLEEGRKIYELGSGWGGVAFELARRYPRHQVIGYEISFLPWLVSVLRNRIGRCSNVTFKLRNIHNAGFENAGLLVCYLMPNAMERLAAGLVDKVNPGTWVVSNTFALPGWNHEVDVIADDRHRSHVYAYLVKGVSQSA